MAEHEQDPKPLPPADAVWLSPGEVSTLFRIRPRTIYGLLARGEISAVKVGGQWRISRERLEERARETA